MEGGCLPNYTGWGGNNAQLNWMGGGMTPNKSAWAAECRLRILDERATEPYARWDGHGSPV